MPAISEILDSVLVPALVRDPLINKGTFARNAKGPEYYSGGFTVVFPVTVGMEKWAFRCWHSDLGNVRNRFKIVSDYINELNSPYFCDFYYCDEGIVVDGKLYPTTRMKWVEGKTINQYIIDNVNNHDALHTLAAEFIAMIDFLHEKKISHGDLQHGNIIVQDGKIKLVDYDSLFVPGLEGSSEIITGKADFQHPKRKNLKIASEKVDYFSELVIYLSIIALAKQPALLNDYSLDDSLLFHSPDWQDFKNSRIYSDLSKIKSDDISLLVKILDDYLQQSDLQKLKPFTELWRDMLKEPVIKLFTCGNVDGIVFKGEDTEITWEAENVAVQYLDGVEIPLGTSNYKKVFNHDTNLTLVLHNGLHDVVETKMVKVVEKPSIKISAAKTKLRKITEDIEDTSLTWDVTNAQSVALLCGVEILSTSTCAKGFKISPRRDATYELVAIGLDGKTQFRESILVIVRAPAHVIFEADKNYTLPSVPVTISWVAKDAKQVQLGDIAVPMKGQAVFEPMTDTVYHLLVEDDFGKTDYEVNVRMLPLPVVKSLLVDTPHINNAVGIQYTAPHFEAVPSIPVIETDFERMEIPPIKDLKQSGLYVELPNPHRDNLSTRFAKFITRIIKK